MNIVARKIILVLFSTGLIGCGVYILVASLAHPNFYGILRGAGPAIILMALGGYMLWDDFVTPYFRKPRQ